MKIERVSLYHLRMPLVAPFETSFGRIHTRDCILIEINSQGLAGYGECVADQDPGYSSETSGTAWHILRDFILPAILGEDVHNPVDFQSRVAGVRGHAMAKAGVEMALWDLLGKRDGLSLREMLGGRQNQVAVGVSVGIQASAPRLVEVVGSYLQQGYGRIKIKIKPGRDVPDTRLVRDAFPKILLQVTLTQRTP